MLKNLHISNYAIIDHLDLEFKPGLTIITGETGAGKSILLGALGLILGKRADSTVLFNADRKCIVEAEIDLSSYKLHPIFQDEEIEYEETCIIRREINAKGKSRAFVNDTPTNLNFLKKLSSRLIDLHQQFDTLEINSEDFQIDILDALNSDQKTLIKYTEIYLQYKKDKRVLESQLKQQDEAEKERDFLKFQVDELDKLDLEAGEYEVLENNFKRLQGSEEIKTTGDKLVNILEESDDSILEKLFDLLRDVENISEIDQTAADIYQRLLTVKEEIQDIARSSTDLADGGDIDQEQVEITEQRINEINRLLNKHRLKSDTELLELHFNISEKLSAFNSLENTIAELQNNIKNHLDKLSALAATITSNRKKSGTKLSKEVNKILQSLSMENAQLQVGIEASLDYKVTGKDKVTFLFVANKGGIPQPLHKVASGGELSRLNLAIKSIVAHSITLPTLIFDEIDTGVSGDVAMKMGNLIKSLSKEHQTIVITHSPQVASRADVHYFIYKKDEKERTHTRMRILPPEERILEIAKMLSGDPPSQEAQNNAIQLIRNN